MMRQVSGTVSGIGGDIRTALMPPERVRLILFVVAGILVSACSEVKENRFVESVLYADFNDKYNFFISLNNKKETDLISYNKETKKYKYYKTVKEVSYFDIINDNILVNEYDNDKKYSELIICNQDFSECSKIFESEGSIANPKFIAKNELILLISPYVKQMNENAGYGYYDIYKFSMDSNKLSRITDIGFFKGYPIYLLKDTVYFSATIGNQISELYEEWGEGYSISYLDDVNIKKNRFFNYKKIDVKASIDVKLGENILYYGAITYFGKYKWRPCLIIKNENREVCAPNESSYPIIKNSGIYYAYYNNGDYFIDKLNN